MTGARLPLLKRIVALLCGVLALLSSGTAMAGVIDHLQHASPFPAAHHHMVFSDIGWNDDDARASQDSRDGQDKTSNGDLASHHHHADVGSGLPAFAAEEAVTFYGVLKLRVFGAQPFVVGLGAAGLDRPPRGAYSIA